jgi:hypothetical protein
MVAVMGTFGLKLMKTQQIIFRIADRWASLQALLLTAQRG